MTAAALALVQAALSPDNQNMTLPCQSSFSPTQQRTKSIGQWRSAKHYLKKPLGDGSWSGQWIRTRHSACPWDNQPFVPIDAQLPNHHRQIHWRSLGCCFFGLLGLPVFSTAVCLALGLFVWQRLHFWASQLPVLQTSVWLAVCLLHSINLACLCVLYTWSWLYRNHSRFISNEQCVFVCKQRTLLQRERLSFLSLSPSLCCVFNGLVCRRGAGDCWILYEGRGLCLRGSVILLTAGSCYNPWLKAWTV